MSQQPQPPPPAYSSPGYPPPQGQPPQGYAPPPQGYAPPPQGYAPPPQGMAQNASASNVTVVSTQPQTVVTGNCPACHMGYLADDYTGLGICLAIFFFPLGVLCCLALKERRCTRCGATF